MAARSVRLLMLLVVLMAALLLAAPRVEAGGMVPTAGRSRYVPTAANPTTASTTVARRVTVAVAVRMPAKAAEENVEVDLRGPDGQVRRFPVEGGLTTIQYRSITLRAGEAVTIHWVPAK